MPKATAHTHTDIDRVSHRLLADLQFGLERVELFSFPFPQFLNRGGLYKPGPKAAAGQHCPLFCFIIAMLIQIRINQLTSLLLLLSLTRSANATGNNLCVCAAIGAARAGTESAAAAAATAEEVGIDKPANGLACARKGSETTNCKRKQKTAA